MSPERIQDEDKSKKRR